MRVAKWTIAAMALAFWLIPDTGHAKALYTFKVGQWSGRAWQNDRTGKFSHCTVSMRYRSGLRFALSHFVSGRYSIALHKREWRLGKGKRYGVQLLVDGKSLGRFRAKALSDRLLSLFLSGASPVVKRLRNGNVLVIRAAQRDFRFKLTDSAKAIDRIKGCVALGRQSAEPKDSNPFARDLGAGRGTSSSPPARSLSRRGSTNPRLEGFIRTLLQNAGLTGIRFDPPKKRKSRTVAASWRAPGLFGQYMVVNHKGRSIDEVTGPFLASLGRKCKGRYGYGADVARQSGSYLIKRSSAACSAKGKGRFYVFATSVRSARTIVIITHVARDRRQAELREMNGELEKVLATMLARL